MDTSKPVLSTFKSVINFLQLGNIPWWSGHGYLQITYWISEKVIFWIQWVQMDNLYTGDQRQCAVCNVFWLITSVYTWWRITKKSCDNLTIRFNLQYIVSQTYDKVMMLPNTETSHDNLAINLRYYLIWQTYDHKLALLTFRNKNKNLKIKRIYRIFTIYFLGSAKKQISDDEIFQTTCFTRPIRPSVKN